MEDLNKDMGDIQIYELGYHLLPTVPEEKILEEVAQIHAVISESKGSVIGEGAPVLKNLAYDMGKRIETKSLNFSKAYFGWIKFETERSGIENIQKKVEVLPSVLRFLIVKTVRENTMHTPKIPVFKKEVEASGVPKEIMSAEKSEASEAEIDKSIDELVGSSAL